MNQSQYSPQGFTLLPPVVKNLLILNGIFYLATFALGNAFNINLVDTFGLHYWASDSFKPWQFITYMFMHDPSNITHILFNMFALWMFGYLLENVWGGRKFLIYYFFTGIGAALFHYLIWYYQFSPVLDVINAFISHPTVETYKNFQDTVNFSYMDREHAIALNSQIVNALYSNDYKSTQVAVEIMQQYRAALLNAPVVIGASGAIFGILLAFGMLFPNTLIYLYFFIPIKAKWFVILYGAIELYSGVFNKSEGVAHFAHLGGMIFGFILIMIWKHQNRRKNDFWT
ncbi:MAG: rhomboid family intramembrane serine protease [Bacteroidota bacterium]|nr:rhomboid family intramembrane serine protease [Bacteroidota bacterium]